MYKGLLDLKGSLERWRTAAPDIVDERLRLADLIQAQAAAVELAAAEPAWGDTAGAQTLALQNAVLELKHTLIPYGLHVVGQAPSPAERIDLLAAIAEGAGAALARTAIEALVDGQPAKAALAGAGVPAEPEAIELCETLVAADRLLRDDHEVAGIIHALDGRFVRPAPGGDLLRNPAILPTGRNLHGLDPFRIPSAFALADGARQAARLLSRHTAEGHALPETVALVLWGTDNLKSEGGPIGQALALIGPKPRFDGFGRLCGADLIPLSERGRPRIGVVMTLSGIFRDLLQLQTKLLAEASWLAASAGEPLPLNFVRKHALACQGAQGCDLEIAALRVFSNADGAYGSKANHLVDSGCREDEDELAETYTRRKCFAYGRSGEPAAQPALLKAILGGVQLAYQNLESVEVGVTTVDHYFDTLGGIGRAVRRASGTTVPVYIGDQTRSEGYGADARRAGGARDPDPDAQSQVVGCSSTGTRVSRPTSPTPWAGPPPPARWRPGSIGSSPRPTCSTPRCASDWRSSIRPRPLRSRTASWKPTSASTGRPIRRCWRRCARRGRSWKTGSKASMRE